jgi:hypothetical protein
MTITTCSESEPVLLEKKGNFKAAKKASSSTSGNLHDQHAQNAGAQQAQKGKYCT